MSPQLPLTTWGERAILLIAAAVLERGVPVVRLRGDRAQRSIILGIALEAGKGRYRPGHPLARKA